MKKCNVKRIPEHIFDRITAKLEMEDKPLTHKNICKVYREHLKYSKYVKV